MNKGFTLIEVLVTISILSLISGLVADTFFNVYRNYNKASVNNEAKQTGEYILTLAEKALRDASTISLECSDGTQIIADCSLPTRKTAKFKITKSPNNYQELGCVTGSSLVNGYIYQKIGSEVFSENLLTNKESGGLDVYDCNLSLDNINQTKVAKISFKLRESTGVPQKLDLKVNMPFELSVVIRN